jgi:hypothetical protein
MASPATAFSDLPTGIERDTPTRSAAEVVFSGRVTTTPVFYREGGASITRSEGFDVPSGKAGRWRGKSSAADALCPP